MTANGGEPIRGGTTDSGVTWEVDGEGFAEILFDTPASRVNLLRSEALVALEEAIDLLERREGVRGLTLRSRKPGVFVAGADVEQIAGVTCEEEALGKIRGGQYVFDRLDSLPFPTLAAISGTCLGGGLEMALACDARLAADSEEPTIGLPEVKLGIIPGWGGTQRLPRLVPLAPALDLILSGRALRPRQARRIGLVDGVTPPERLLADARRMIREMATGRTPARRRALPDRIARRWPVRPFLLSRAASAVRSRTGGHYPAPLAALDAIGTGLARGMEAGLEREASLDAKLITGAVSRNLVRIFLDSRAPAGEEAAEAPRILRMGVLGAGVMGGGIAAVAAARGYPSRMRDLAPDPLQRGMEHAWRILQGRGRRRKPESWTWPRLIGISPTLTLEGFGSCDLIVEAVVEDLDLKRRVFAEAEREVGESCILASNTSSLSIDAMASALARPERFVGLHFFNPAERMPLVEVVRGPRTSPETVAAVSAFSRKIGKTPVVVGDAPGFVVNRLLMPYLAEALQVVAAGAEIQRVDGTVERFGMPMGPMALLDQIGLDVAAKVARILGEAFGERLPSFSGLDAMVRKGWLGAKSKAGFYVHHARRPIPRAEAAELLRREGSGAAAGPEDLVRRLLYPVINEAAVLLREGVAGSAADVDLAMVLGTGFPPFLGGPLRWADSLGLAAVVEGLREMAGSGAGPHLAPSEALEEAAAAGGFHRG